MEAGKDSNLLSKAGIILIIVIAAVLVIIIMIIAS